VKRWFAVNEISNIPDHDFPHPIAALLKRELCRITPGAFPKKVFMGRGGAEANEHAIKLALEMRPEGTDFAFVGSFHGRSRGALRFTSSKSVQWKGFVPQADRPKFLPFPEDGHDCSGYWLSLHEGNDLRLLRDMYAECRPRIFFAEAVQGEGDDAHVGFLATDDGVFVHIVASFFLNRYLRAEADLALLLAVGDNLRILHQVFKLLDALFSRCLQIAGFLVLGIL